MIVVSCAIGAYAIQNAMFDIWLMLGFGVVGYVFKKIEIPLAPFTLVGATTRSGLITTPLRDRFGIPVRLNFYTADELCLIVELSLIHI